MILISFISFFVLFINRLRSNLTDTLMQAKIGRCPIRAT